MTIAAVSPREFRVHAGHIDRRHAHLAPETCFEAAAVACMIAVEETSPND